MPLIVITGFPCSTKTTRTQQLFEHFGATFNESGREIKTVVVNDNDFSGFAKDTVYSSSRLEKDLRAYLKSEVQKHLNKDTLVILDSLNYIKGYRYELYCVARSAQTTTCVVWCDISKEQACNLNSKRSSELMYPENVQEELIMRYEQPDSKNRWDSPLFIVQLDDTIPYEQMSDSLFKSKPPPPNLSTVAQPLQPTNFMYELDKITNDVIRFIISAQKTAVIGDKIKVQDGGELLLSKQINLAELNKLRRQFITYMKLNPVHDVSKLSFMFTNYLQSNI